MAFTLNFTIAFFQNKEGDLNDIRIYVFEIFMIFNINLLPDYFHGIWRILNVNILTACLCSSIIYIFDACCDHVSFVVYQTSALQCEIYLMKCYTIREMSSEDAWGS